MRRRVVCGLSETIATLPPQSALTSVDFPTFGRPATATNPLLIARSCPLDTARRWTEDRACSHTPGERRHDEIDHAGDCARARRRRGLGGGRRGGRAEQQGGHLA